VFWQSANAEEQGIQGLVSGAARCVCPGTANPGRAQTAKPAHPAFEIDPGKLADEARYDGLFVLRTNTRITPLQAVLRYRDLLQVDTCSAPPRRSSEPPNLHSCDAAIRGHVFCSFSP
jgi:hypothetical protein